ncbi:hypothetical protein SDC9_160787 [bioreactor metagenome]|uniref:Uncharacterized protein n=1 Tax=bioreactor metagenome TaxID=1076179 RepID=A0A645FIK4_9ZZZZ
MGLSFPKEVTMPEACRAPRCPFVTLCFGVECENGYTIPVCSYYKYLWSYGGHTQ